MKVFVERCQGYDEQALDKALEPFVPLFAERIKPGSHVAIKPNWLAHRHKYDEHEWLSVVTHPNLITAVLKIVLRFLGGSGKITLADAPQTDSQFDKIMKLMHPEKWVKMGKEAGVEVVVADLRDHAWKVEGDVMISRTELPGDPLGSTECDLAASSEFVGHKPSPRGYFGADYDKAETNKNHSDGHHRYRVSRSVIEADTFVTIPKWKSHKKAGITCSLKNLVGINTYKNFLPHHNEGTPAEGGDQFPESKSKNKLESILNEKFRAVLIKFPQLGKLMVPVKGVGKKIFGETKETIRNGAWYGNDTLWRTVLDLNKVLLYANPDGSLRPDAFESRKKYISIIDGIIAGHGNGPDAPTPKECNFLIAGTNPVAVDMACARYMWFDWRKIGSLKGAFEIKKYKLADFGWDDIVVESTQWSGARKLSSIPFEECFKFKAHFGWIGHIELDVPSPGGVSRSAQTGAV